MATDEQIEAVARVIVNEMTESTYDDLYDRYSLSHSKRSVKKYWLDVATIAIDAYEKLEAAELAD